MAKPLSIKPTPVIGNVIQQPKLNHHDRRTKVAEQQRLLEEQFRKAIEGANNANNGKS